MLTDLCTWARSEGLLPGQRARSLQRVQVAMRNAVAHRSDYSLGNPPDAARAISDVAEIINCLWGARTPGGRLHPAPTRRDVLMIAWANDDRVDVSMVETMRAEGLPDDRICILVRAVGDGDFDPWQFDALYETTTYPAELL